LNASTGSQPGDLSVVKTLFPSGIIGIPSTDPAYQRVQQVLSTTASARAAGKAILFGYSYGASLTAAAAVEANRLGSRFTVCAIIGAPISSDLLSLYQTACGTSIVVDIPGDAIQAGSTSFYDTAWDFLLQFFNSQFSAPHFFYAQDINVPPYQQRRDGLVAAWNASGTLSGQCPDSQ